MGNAMLPKSDHTKKYWTNEKCPHIQVLRRKLYYIKLFFLVCFVGFTLPLLWLQYAIELNRPHNVDNVDRIYYTCQKTSNKKNYKLPKDLKYILIWTRAYRAPMTYFGFKQKMFLKNNCSVNKCFITRNREYFQGNITKFDAIAFIGQDLNISDMPDVRSWHQKYIYYNMESADNYPACKPEYDGFFNWTSTYRLDSDIPYPYMLIRDMNGKIVGPKQKMRWNKNMPAVGEEFVNRIVNKKKAAAWFVSNCRANGRIQLVRDLKYALLPYGLTVDVYGKCGTLDCPRGHFCNKMLERDYFFYMSLENTITEDYVTEKLLRALRHDVVPIVYGGADYSRFLPPGSYINARKYKVPELAAIMHRLMNSPKHYLQFFRWKNYYTYHDPIRIDNVCALCEALHDQKKMKTTTIYYKFRRWWNPNFKKQCVWYERLNYINVTSTTTSLKNTTTLS